MATSHGVGPTSANWYPDPGGEHQYRYWDGGSWTVSVSDDGVVTQAPVPPQLPSDMPPPPGARVPSATVPSPSERLEARRGSLTNDNVFLAPDIPEKRLVGATTKYAKAVDPAEVLLLVDTSLRGNGKAGFVLTSTGLVAHDAGMNADLRLDEIRDVEIKSGTLRIGGEQIVLVGGLGDAAEALVELLTEIGGGTGARDVTPALTADDGAGTLGAEWATGSSLIAEGPRKTGLDLERRAFRPGERVSFALHLDPWPDAKLTEVRVELVFRHSHFLHVWVDPAANAHTPGGMLFSQPAHWEDQERGPDGAEPGVAVVDAATILPSQVGPDGVVSGSLTLPETCPPTIDGVVEWQVRATASRRHGFTHDGAVGITVAAVTADATSAPGVGADDWLLRVFGATGGLPKGVAAVDRPREVYVTVDAVDVAPGENVTGEVVARVDPVGFYVHTTHATTARGRRKIDASAGQMPRSLEVERITVSLECWRGSERRGGFLRVARISEDVWGPGVLESEREIRVPFTLAVPEKVDFRLNTLDESKGGEPRPVLPTFCGARFGELQLDDLRWRVCAQIIAPESQWGHLAGHGVVGGKLGYSGDVMTSPLWAATEIVIIPERGVPADRASAA